MSDSFRSETELIVQKAITSSHDKLLKELPIALKPAMYEVAEKVSHRVEARIGDLLGVDVHDIESKRALRDDLSYLRNAHMQRRKAKHSFLNAWFSVPIKLLIGGIGAVFAYLLGRFQ